MKYIWAYIPLIDSIIHSLFTENLEQYLKKDLEKVSIKIHYHFPFSFW